MNLRFLIWPCLLVGALLVGCAGPGGQGGAITSHRWHRVSTPPTQPWVGERSRLYTYVLIGDSASGVSSGGARQARLALGKVLEEVAEHSVMPRVGENAIPLDSLNQFVVPSRQAVQGPLTLDNYDIDLAHDYLAWFQSALRAKADVQAKLRGLGPFLVALHKPLPELMSRSDGAWTVSSSEPILVFDLSGAAPAAVPKFVREYKEIVAKDFSATNAPMSWRADLASALIKWGDALPKAIAATAKAGEIVTGKTTKDKP